MKKPGPDWVQAPGFVVQELRLVWQEDDMPDDLKNSPGYVPFTLSADAQSWVESMQEVREVDGTVYGHPKPVVAREHVIHTQQTHPPASYPGVAPVPQNNAPQPTWNPPIPEEVKPRPMPAIGRAHVHRSEPDSRPRMPNQDQWDGILDQRRKEVERVKREAAERRRTAELFGSSPPPKPQKDRGIPEIG